MKVYIIPFPQLPLSWILEAHFVARESKLSSALYDAAATDDLDCAAYAAFIQSPPIRIIRRILLNPRALIGRHTSRSGEGIEDFKLGNDKDVSRHTDTEKRGQYIGTGSISRYSAQSN
jgi:hypothetical protein